MKKKEEFVVLRISRDDINEAGYDASNLSDEMMEELAGRMKETILGSGYFWEFLKEFGESSNLPKTED